jgi:tetratricopeptide (TPR) repeat protein
VLLVLLARDEDAGTRFGEARPVRHLRLRELSPAATAELTRRLIGDDAGPLASGDELAQRSGGNPLFLEELVRRARAGRTGPLPETLLALVTEVIDRLPHDEQSTLKCASVFGRTFSPRELEGALADVEDIAAPVPALTALAARGLLRRERAPADYAFRSDTLQEVAYESMSHATRRHLHRAAGSWYERHAEPDLDAQLDRIAYHYGRSDDTGKQRTYFALAGRRAARLFANDVAIDYFQRLLPLVAGPEHVETLVDLGEVYEHVGRWDDARERFEQAVAAGEPPPRLLTAMGRLLSEAESLAQAQSWLERGLERARAVHDDTVALEALDRLSVVCGQRGDNDGASRHAHDELRTARRYGNRVAIAGALSNIAHVELETGDLDRAHELLLEAHAPLHETGPSRLRWEIEIELMTSCQRRCDLAAAKAWLDESIETARAIGYAPGLAVSTLAEADMRLELGDYAGAESVAWAALGLALEEGNRRSVIGALGVTADARAGGGDVDDALVLLDLADRLARALDDTRYLAEVMLTRAQYEFDRSGLDAAQQALEEAERLAGDANPDAAERAALLRIRLDLARGRCTAAAAAARLDRYVGAAVQEQDRAIALHERSKLAPHDDDRRVAALEALHAVCIQAASAEVRRRYEALAGEPFPLPEVFASSPPAPPGERERLLARVRDVLARVQAAVATGAEPPA